MTAPETREEEEEEEGRRRRRRGEGTLISLYVLSSVVVNRRRV